MENLRFRLRNSSLEAYPGSETERTNLDFAEVGEDNKFLADGLQITIRGVNPGSFSSAAVYEIAVIAE
jgi:hypothetical protein